MRNGFACVGFIFGVVGLTTTSVFGAGAPPHFSLKAVRLNGGEITHTNELSVQPGDEIEAEIRISGWAKELPGGARGYTARIAGRAGAVSGGNGTILPLGWNAKLDPLVCWPDPTVCDPEETCNLSQWCVYPGHNPAMGAFIDPGHADFILSGLSLAARDVSINTLDYKFFALAVSGTAIDNGGEKYAGTLKLVVSDFACGEFTFTFTQSSDTELGDEFNVGFPPTVEPLILQAGTCGPIPIMFDPPNCAVDAGIPHDPDNAAIEFGIDTYRVTFDVAAAGMDCSDFKIRSVPAPGPSCVNVATSGFDALIHLSEDIPLNKWTCVRHNDSNVRACVGYLPADSDASTMTETVDIEALILNLDGDFDPPDGMHLIECDVDRSELCTPLDILSAVDLINGAGAFDSWEFEEIPALCPTR